MNEKPYEKTDEITQKVLEEVVQKYLKLYEGLIETFIAWTNAERAYNTREDLEDLVESQRLRCEFIGKRNEFARLGREEKELVKEYPIDLNKYPKLRQQHSTLCSLVTLYQCGPQIK